MLASVIGGNPVTVVWISLEELGLGAIVSNVRWLERWWGGWNWEANKDIIKIYTKNTPCSLRDVWASLHSVFLAVAGSHYKDFCIILWHIVAKREIGLDSPSSLYAPIFFSLCGIDALVPIFRTCRFESPPPTCATSWGQAMRFFRRKEETQFQ